MLFLFYVTLFLVFVINDTLASSIFNFKNNACDTSPAYYFQFLASNTKCHHTDEVKLRMPERVKFMVGEYGETHTVTTKDGYILKLFRLRHPNPKGVILMNPPYTSDSGIWLSHGNESMGFIFWQQGYDVWMSNHRGTDYGNEHVTLNRKSPIFWDFTFHEIGVYDMKAIVDHIYNATSMKLVMIGHSMSTTTSYIYASMHPEDAAKKVRLIVATAPIAYLHHVEGVAPLGAPFYKIGQRLGEMSRVTHSFTSDDPLFNLAKKIYYFVPFKGIVPYVMSITMGHTAPNFDPVFLGSAPYMLSGTAVKPMYHYGQIWGRKRFGMYDYGPIENNIVYGQNTPPDYPLDKIKVPIFLVASKSDYLSSMTDAYLFYNQLKPEARVYGLMVVTGINHVDHHFSFHRMEKVWNPMMDLIDIVSFQEDNY